MSEEVSELYEGMFRREWCGQDDNTGTPTLVLVMSRRERLVLISMS